MEHNKNNKGGLYDRRLPHHINREGRDDDNDESESESNDNDNSNDTDLYDMSGKYDSKGYNKGKGGRCKYKYDDKIKDIHGLYEEPKEDDRDHCDHDEDWDNMEEKEWDNEEDDEDVIDITAAQLLGTPNEAFLIKKNKKTEAKKGDGGCKNGNGR